MEQRPVSMRNRVVQHHSAVCSVCIAAEILELGLCVAVEGRIFNLIYMPFVKKLRAILLFGYVLCLRSQEVGL